MNNQRASFKSSSDVTVTVISLPGTEAGLSGRVFGEMRKCYKMMLGRRGLVYLGAILLALYIVQSYLWKTEGSTHKDSILGLREDIDQQMNTENQMKVIALNEDLILEGNKLNEQFDNYREKKREKSGTPYSELFVASERAYGDYFSQLERVVHLDLKGAPPLVSYLEALFPVLRKLGATALLMEYEDMFPYSGNLSLLARDNAYSMADLRRIQLAAKSNRLDIIPLVQTFGHMEFVLKKEEFQSLREDESARVITPVKQESYQLLFEMVDQIVQAHPNCGRLHLGCDEVYDLGKGQSRRFANRNSLSPQQLFLQHVTKVARRVKVTFPNVQLLIWDDWLRSIPFNMLARSGLHRLVEPVVWYYRHDVQQKFRPALWKKYRRLFPGVWVASAFKGATGIDQVVTSSTYHLQNNLQWVKALRFFGALPYRVPFRGTVLTGWQRYNHFSVLCELLPAGLPSLALSLRAVRSGGFGPGEVLSASQALACPSLLNLEKDPAALAQDCRFPGYRVYYMVEDLWTTLQAHERGGAGKMIDARTPKQLCSVAETLKSLTRLVGTAREAMLPMYNESTVEEWTHTHLQKRLAQLKDVLSKTVLAYSQTQHRFSDSKTLAGALPCLAYFDQLSAEFTGAKKRLQAKGIKEGRAGDPGRGLVHKMDVGASPAKKNTGAGRQWLRQGGNRGPLSQSLLRKSGGNSAIVSGPEKGQHLNVDAHKKKSIGKLKAVQKVSGTKLSQVLPGLLQVSNYVHRKGVPASGQIEKPQAYPQGPNR